ncbi:ZPP protein, partial [Polypterus senegalus]
MLENVPLDDIYDGPEPDEVQPEQPPMFAPNEGQTGRLIRDAIVDFRYKESYRNYCHQEFSWDCSSGDCGYTRELRYGQIDSSPLGDSWCQAEGFMSRSVPGDKPFDLRVPQNCPTTYSMLAYDPDGDHVKCRYGKSNNSECSICAQPAGFGLNEILCELSYYGSQSGEYMFELVMEDFPQRHIQLQYSDGSAVSKSPLYSVRKRKRRETNLYTTTTTPSSTECIDNIMISGPLNITKSYQYDNQTRIGEAQVTWTPSENDQGESIPICFFAETHEGYQSELRCVVVTVGRHNFLPLNNREPIESSQRDLIEVFKIMKGISPVDQDCDFKNEFNKITGMLLKKIRGDHGMHLGKTTANTKKVNPTYGRYVELCIPLTTGTFLLHFRNLSRFKKENDTEIIFQNEITKFDQPNQVISRKNQVEIPFSCSYPKIGTASATFSPHKANYLFSEAGFGSFTFVFEFYDSSNFTSIIDPSEYPIEVELGQMLYMSISVESQLDNIVLFVQDCRATPHDDPNDPTYYDIISDGCVQDDTTIIFPSNQTEFRFGMAAFTFIGDYSQVYMTCTVILCTVGSPGTRCSQGCVNSTSAVPRYRRSLASESQEHFISQGPLYLERKNQYNDSKRKRSLHHQEHLAALREMQVADIQQQELNRAQRERHLQRALEEAKQARGQEAALRAEEHSDGCFQSSIPQSYGDACPGNEWPTGIGTLAD